MKNITFSVDEDTLYAMRIYAAKKRTTVNARVREFLGKIARTEAGAGMAKNPAQEPSETDTQNNRADNTAINPFRSA